MPPLPSTRWCCKPSSSSNPLRALPVNHAAASSASAATTVAEINLSQLRHNAGVLQALAGDAPLMGVVKADAYGHGAPVVARTLQASGVTFFAVATVPEAVTLREAGLTAPILVFAAPLPSALPAYARYDLDVTVASVEGAAAVAIAARTSGPLRVHLKIDTGMGRLGVQPEQTDLVLRQLLAAPGITVASLWTHFATADEPGHPFTKEQWTLFETLCRRAGDAVPLVHAANSGALLTFPPSFQRGSRTLVRTGIALYGLYDPSGLADPPNLRPVMRLTSRVTHIKTVAAETPISYGGTWRAPRPTRIATVGAGYADGYRRALSNRAFVGIDGSLFPVAGTVCMDMFMVDLGAAGGPGEAVAVGDEVVLFGPGGPSALDVARWAGTIAYEIACGISARVPRNYVE